MGGISYITWVMMSRKVLQLGSCRAHPHLSIHKGHGGHVEKFSTGEVVGHFNLDIAQINQETGNAVKVALALPPPVRCQGVFRERVAVLEFHPRICQPHVVQIVTTRVVL